MECAAEKRNIIIVEYFFVVGQFLAAGSKYMLDHMKYYMT